MLDLLQATNELYGNCSQEPGSTDIFIDGVLATSDQMIAINTKATELEASYDALEYSRLRKIEYDKLNQFELISDDSINGTTTHKDAILAIKASIPKPV